MISQSDLPFRLLTRRYCATLTYTQMLHPSKLLSDQEYLEFHLRDLQMGSRAGEEGGRPVVVQVCGNEVQMVVEGARRVVGVCDAIDLNLGCPQTHAKEGHYGAYLLDRKDWPLVENMVSALHTSLPLPISTKLRLCQPTTLTPLLSQRLQASGASWITLHARYPSARRRRQGAAYLDEVKRLKEGLRGDGVEEGIPVVSNGNVRCWEDIERNREWTGAEGVMVGETLLGNPCLFAGITPDPVLISLEYLQLAKDYPTATIDTIRTHVRHFVEFQCSRKPWYTDFRASLGKCESVEDMEVFLRGKVRRWRGEGALVEDEEGEGEEREEGEAAEGGEGPDMGCG